MYFPQRCRLRQRDSSPETKAPVPNDNVKDKESGGIEGKPLTNKGEKKMMKYWFTGFGTIKLQ
jgi:hypothetical protein